ncbi:TPA_asm: 4'-phosphopantetheinyl transferase [Salmonella enterica subsp. enterica serovar Dublin]|uniref:4'-phosphopantetheinyl transferase n=1 Tax=Salmonella dublin TaxID=98360 RepID=A0A732D6L1_SALDU|nr:4'-phosphopantetheinyl transferase [Salmonella enterica subsp. enterica serovar 4,[5],12:b:-]EGC5998976.1 4'-phosphopantetheinyl transferase [Salmonella enterica]EKR1395936.1 restriction endonuclease subunit S [Salmonella enterica subsp. enterica serovar Dublin]EKR1404053.1 restriction endonuclease subunit S [Salmonella enterica subsp. enterica serovar Dublin]HAC6852947.1 4'-phosphopantetheinyl transferase [Salmonella enterica subsp. enterica serovar Dublin]
MSDFKFHTPNSWILSLLPDIAGINMGQSPSSSDVNEQGEGIVFFQGKAEFGKLYPTPRKYCTKPTKIASVGDILLSIRAPVGPTNIATETTAIGRGLAAISAHRGLTDSKYLLYYFRCIEPWLSTQGTGSTFKAISGQFIKELKAPLPSFAEQKIIAEKLDTLLAQVDSTKARLEQIPQILKRFRQAILAAAISGKLTDKWRKLTDLQTIWKSHTLGELVTIDRGSSPRPIKDYITTDENGVNWIKIGDTKEGEKYILSTKERITKEGSKKSRKVTPGDFILSNSMSLGRAYIVEIEGYVHDGWFILRLPENIDKNYFYYLLSSSQLQTQFSSLAVGGVVQNIRSELVKQAIVNIPPLSEQHEIVRRVEQLFAYADTIEKLVNSALTRVNSLTQSILAKAFRGELTAQWRAENPDLISGENSAAALLEKIKAERAASGGKKTSRKKA